MGNCMETYKNSTQTEILKPHEDQDQDQEKVESETSDDNKKKNGSNMRIKIVLTKDELEWLMSELKNRQGKGLEEVLGEIQRSRGRVAAWKPSLDSIIESPEVPEGMDR